MPSPTDRDIAQKISLIMKGKSLPDSYTNVDVLQIIYRYWHRAMERDIGDKKI